MFVRKTDRKRPFGRLRFKREDNIKMDLRGIDWRFGLD
jgi:hypothetical protein